MEIKCDVGEKMSHLLESHQSGARGWLSVSTIGRSMRDDGSPEQMATRQSGGGEDPRMDVSWCGGLWRARAWAGVIA